MDAGHGLRSGGGGACIEIYFTTNKNITPTTTITTKPIHEQEGLKPVFDEAIRCVLEHQNKPQKKKNKCVVC